RQSRKDAGDLEGASDSTACDHVRWLAGDVSAREDDAPGVRLQTAGDEVEERRLAGAVGPDDGVPVRPSHLQADGLDRLQTAERLAQILHSEDDLICRLRC